ncbi:response regulator transcription factor [Gramella lutea]|uniref:Response regulator transcription factor n=1 Tax=Christiangramia lutea TaxID=1607951 RepID=A0A9X1V205_9FLAO|nr:LytTR family DNA-binding domain-containing protein [Christiangramia lutea]MCH4822810.1 response regulator transcription factor [Christiangramia lutea]
MATQEKIIIVENDIPMAAKLSLQLNRLGYKITGIFSRSKDALYFLEREVPDLILLDDKLKGKLNGLNGNQPSSPIIYFNKSSAEAIESLIPRSVKQKKGLLKKELKNSLKKIRKTSQRVLFDKNKHYILKDRIFIKHRDRMLKISLDDIQYIEADRNYCKVYSENKNYLLVTTLKEVEEKLIDRRFLRIHRSYIVNISHIDEIGGNYVVIFGHSLPLSKNMRQELFNHLQVI